MPFAPKGFASRDVQAFFPESRPGCWIVPAEISRALLQEVLSASSLVGCCQQTWVNKETSRPRNQSNREENSPLRFLKNVVDGFDAKGNGDSMESTLGKPWASFWLSQGWIRTILCSTVCKVLRLCGWNRLCKIPRLWLNPILSRWQDKKKPNKTTDSSAPERIKSSWHFISYQFFVVVSSKSLQGRERQMELSSLLLPARGLLSHRPALEEQPRAAELSQLLRQPW